MEKQRKGTKNKQQIKTQIENKRMKEREKQREKDRNRNKQTQKTHRSDCFACTQFPQGLGSAEFFFIEDDAQTFERIYWQDRFLFI